MTGPSSRSARRVVGLVALVAAFSTSVSTTAVRHETPLARALAFLDAQQIRQPIDVVIDGRRLRDFPGNWPQHYALRGSDRFRVRDVSPFTVAFIHHALTSIIEEHRRPLRLHPRDLRAARAMRRRAVGFMRLFESPPGAPDAGTFAFWPYDTDPATPNFVVTLLLMGWLQGPVLGGQRVPLNLAVFPSPLAIPSDADVTATTYASLLDDERVDGGSGSTAAFERFFADWRDLGVVPRRENPAWMPASSGAFLTWLTYRAQPFPLFPNDVDLVVNANVLYALGRYGRLDTPGVTDAVGLIDLATALGRHRDAPGEIALYYPDNFTFHYAVSRAFREGGVHGLAPAVGILADDLEASAQWRPDGTAFWDRGAPRLNTAFAVLALLNAGRDGPVVDAAVEYLISSQDADGGFGDAVFFIGRTDGGQVFEFSSASFTTAMALEALARHALARDGR